MFPQVFGKYVLERELGRGGMARVFLATLRGAGGFEKRLVVKQIRPELACSEEFVQRFVAEAKTAVSLSHPNIVPVYELGVEQGTYYIAMELCEGVTLAELLQRRVLSALEGAYVGVEVCRALDYAHRRSVVHRDITPRNVLVDAEGAVRLIDFGIAGSLTFATDASPIATRPQVFGSLGHMSPEHLAGGQVGPKSDLFSVGTVLIEAWTGRAPFRRDTLEETKAALTEPPPALSASNSELAPLDALVRSAVSADLALRPNGAEDLGRPLREFLKTADLGDVARRLGKSVEQMLSERASRPPPPEPNTGEVTTSKSGGKTQTFAVHDEFSELTQPLAGSPNPSLPANNRVSVRSANRPGTTRVVLIGAALLIAVLAGLLLSQSPEPIGIASTPAAPAPVKPDRAAVQAPLLPTSFGASAPASAARPTIGDIPRSPSARASVSSAAVVSAPAASTAPAPAAGFLTLSAEPPCQVLVEGKPRGRTPIRDLSLQAGSYRVEFISDLTNERLEIRIDLSAGEHNGLHADFTTASPRIIAR